MLGRLGRWGGVKKEGSKKERKEISEVHCGKDWWMGGCKVDLDEMKMEEMRVEK